MTGVSFNGTAAEIADGNAVVSYAPPSRIVDEDYVVLDGDYAIGADTAAGDVVVTLPDLGDRFSSVFVRKFSGANVLSIQRGSEVLETLTDDGAARAYDWWPDRTNWYARN